MPMTTAFIHLGTLHGNLQNAFFMELKDNISFYVTVSLPHNAMGWPAVHDCGIHWSYSLTF